MQFHARTVTIFVVLAALAAVPPIAALLGQPFYLDLLRRIMIFAIAALSLNLILGYGGLVSFGHAAYLGIGGYDSPERAYNSEDHSHTIRVQEVGPLGRRAFVNTRAEPIQAYFDSGFPYGTNQWISAAATAWATAALALSQ